MTTQTKPKREHTAEPIDAQVLSRISEIARLKLTPQEMKDFQADSNRILEYFSQVSKLSGEGSQVFYMRPGTAIMRKDEVVKFEGDEGVRGQFPHPTKDGLVKAPKNL